jgi:hypothetical protein
MLEANVKNMVMPSVSARVVMRSKAFAVESECVGKWREGYDCMQGGIEKWSNVECFASKNVPVVHLKRNPAKTHDSYVRRE